MNTRQAILGIVHGIRNSVKSAECRGIEKQSRFLLPYSIEDDKRDEEVLQKLQDLYDDNVLETARNLEEMDPDQRSMLLEKHLADQALIDTEMGNRGFRTDGELKEVGRPKGYDELPGVRDYDFEREFAASLERKLAKDRSVPRRMTYDEMKKRVLEEGVPQAWGDNCIASAIYGVPLSILGTAMGTLISPYMAARHMDNTPNAAGVNPGDGFFTRAGKNISAYSKALQDYSGANETWPEYFDRVKDTATNTQLYLRSLADGGMNSMGHVVQFLDPRTTTNPAFGGRGKYDFNAAKTIRTYENNRHNKELHQQVIRDMLMGRFRDPQLRDLNHPVGAANSFNHSVGYAVGNVGAPTLVGNAIGAAGDGLQWLGGAANSAISTGEVAPAVAASAPNWMRWTLPALERTAQVGSKLPKPVGKLAGGAADGALWTLYRPAQMASWMSPERGMQSMVRGVGNVKNVACGAGKAACGAGNAVKGGWHTLTSGFGDGYWVPKATAGLGEAGNGVGQAWKGVGQSTVGLMHMADPYFAAGVYNGVGKNIADGKYGDALKEFGLGAAIGGTMGVSPWLGVPTMAGIGAYDYANQPIDPIVNHDKFDWASYGMSDPWGTSYGMSDPWGTDDVSNVSGTVNPENGVK